MFSKPSLRLVVDAETGAVLAQHSGDGIDGAAYTDLRVGEHLELSLFTWDGPVTTDERTRIEQEAVWSSAIRLNGVARARRKVDVGGPVSVRVSPQRNAGGFDGRFEIREHADVHASCRGRMNRDHRLTILDGYERL